MHGGTTQQHTKAHGITIGEGNFNGPAHIIHYYRCFNHKAEFAVAAGVGDPSFVINVCLTIDDGGVVFLNGVDFELNPMDAILLLGLHIEGMKCGGACARIDFRFDVLDAEFRKGNPFAPPNNNLFFIHNDEVLADATHIDNYNTNKLVV